MGIAVRNLHFIADDLTEDWLASIDWDAVIRFIIVLGGWSR
jgi:hypothetical protein